MASVGKYYSYRRLRNEEDSDEERLKREVKKVRAWLKLRALVGRRRPRLRVAGLRRIFIRKRTKFVSRFRFSWRKALNKLKNGQSHVNDLFGGNFLLMQGNLAPFGCGKKPYMGYGLQGLPTTTYSTARIT